MIRRRFYRVESDSDEIRHDDLQLQFPTSFEYFALNKPRGYLCSLKGQGDDPLAIDLIDAENVRLFSVGRLDKDSEGLIIFTNDGDLAHWLEDPEFSVVKTYRVTVTGRAPTAEMLKTILTGITHRGECLKAKSVSMVECDQVGCEYVLEFQLTEGKKHEIRRICKAMGWQVLRLQRITIGALELGTLSLGEHRRLIAEELGQYVNHPLRKGLAAQQEEYSQSTDGTSLH